MQTHEERCRQHHKFLDDTEPYSTVTYCTVLCWNVPQINATLLIPRPLPLTAFLSHPTETQLPPSHSILLSTLLPLQFSPKLLHLPRLVHTPGAQFSGLKIQTSGGKPGELTDNVKLTHNKSLSLYMYIYIYISIYLSIYLSIYIILNHNITTHTHTRRTHKL